MVGMSYKQIRERAAKLRQLIDYHRRLYHEKDAPEITDEAYDSLLSELIQLEKDYPELKTPDSPTGRIGGAPIESFQKVKHSVPQWSFDNVFNEEELKGWEDRVQRILSKAGEKSVINYCAEHKIDGLKVILNYRNGMFIQGATRGDGLIGEDVTHNLKTIDDIPLNLRKKVDIIAVGEVWLPRQELRRINKEREKKGELLFANTRNVAAGSLRQLDPKIVRARNLSFFAYDIDFFDAKEERLKIPKTQIEELEFLKDLGFSVNTNYKYCKNLNEIVNSYNYWHDKKDKLSYGVDGLAVKVNEISLQKILGYTAKAPRFAVAFKFKAEQATTLVQDIVLQVGRTGVLTPVAKLRPVLVAGSTVSRTTLHNEDEINRLDVRVGDTVIVQKAGDVIPDIVRVLRELRTGKEKPYLFPKKVAECGGDGSIERIPGQAAYRCVYKNSGAVQRRKLEHFTSKQAFNIVGLGKKIIAKLMENNIISSFDDIFTIKKGDLAGLQGFRDKSIEKLLQSIENSKTITLPRFLTALSILQVGEETAEDLAKHFGSLEKLQRANFEELENIDGVGPIIARQVCDWFFDKENRKLISKLREHVKVLKEEKGEIKSALSGKTFVLTGTMKSMSRDEAKRRIKELGGHVAGSVSLKTDFVVAGENPGSKFDEARKLNVKIISEKEFVRLTHA